jgi:hypothetical protein
MLPDRDLDDLLSGLVDKTGTLTRRIYDLERQENTGGYGINVKHFGAIGDEVTDDTDAIQRAITAVLAAGGGALYFPAGTYKVTSTLSVNLEDPITHLAQSWVIYGDGGRSRINYTPADGTDCLYILNIAAGTNTLNIHDLMILGAGPAAATGNGILLRRCIMPNQVHNVVIKNFGGGAALKLISCWTSDMQIWNYACKYGIKMENDAIPGPYGSMTDCVIRACEIQSNSSHGIYGNCNHLTINTNIIEGNAGCGIYLDHARHIDINNNYFELNTDYDIYAVYTPLISIRHCTGSGTKNVYTDADCTWLISEHNEWDGDVILDGYGVRNLSSQITGGTGGWRNYETQNVSGTLAVNDTTPSVLPGLYNCKFYSTANTVPTTISNLDDGYVGQEIVIFVNDAVTTFDFTGSNLKGNAGVDYAASSGDFIRAIKFGVYWYCQIIK